MLDYQALLYAPIYEQFGQAATLTTTGGDEITLTVQDKTAPSSFAGIGVEFQAFRPTALVRMAEIAAAGITPIDDVQGGELAMSGKSWSIKSFEYVPSPAGIDDGELRLILKDDLNA